MFIQTDEPAKFRKEGSCLSNVHTLWDTVMAQYWRKEIHEILIAAENWKLDEMAAR